MCGGDCSFTYHMYNISMRTCFICKKNKRLIEFYKDVNRAKGYSYICKECERIYRRESRQRNLQTYKAKDKRYYKKHKYKILANRKKWYKANKVKISAHSKVKNALFNGSLKRLPCEVCGLNNTDAHHDNYNYPLDVRWLCRTHHMRHHSPYKE